MPRIKGSSSPLLQPSCPGPTKAGDTPGERPRTSSPPHAKHQPRGLERQSKKTKAILNELQNLLQWFAPDKEVGSLLPGKEGGGVGKGMRGRKGCERQRETLKDTFHFLKIKHLLPPKTFSPVL